jgi:hypothetical protein
MASDTSDASQTEAAEGEPVGAVEEWAAAGTATSSDSDVVDGDVLQERDVPSAVVDGEEAAAPAEKPARRRARAPRARKTTDGSSASPRARKAGAKPRARRSGTSNRDTQG